MNRRAFSSFLLAGMVMPGLSGFSLAAAFADYEAKSFARLLGSGAPLVVHVHADWCSVCRAQVPIMNRILAGPAYKSVRPVRVNFDSDKQFLADYKVVRQSTILVFKGGKEVARLSYDANPARIEETLARATK